MKIVLLLALTALNYGCLPKNVDDKVRPELMKYLNPNLVNKLIGAKVVSLEMPAIPDVSTSTTNADNIGRGGNSMGHPYFRSLSEDKFNSLNLQFLNEVSEVVRQTGFGQEELQNYMNALSQGASREGIYSGLVLDNFYRSLEDRSYNSNEQVLAFALATLEKYLNRTAKKESLQQMNFYSLKRIVAEKLLEVADSFSNEDELYRWFAFYSAELAQKYPQVWKLKIRKVTQEGWHYKWSQKIPADILKSELVLRTHKVFNKLQNI